MKIVGEDETGDLSVKGKNIVSDMDKDMEDETEDLSVKGKNMVTGMDDDMEDEDSYVIVYGSMLARARIDYFHFGDAISFDTTYKKNKAMYECSNDMVEEVMKNVILEVEKINREEALQDKNQGISNIGERDIDVGDDVNVTTVSQHNIRD
ncbi:hypothetical protein HHK36_018717 [Tetracentron sinense]|uniref:Uncharacterized protein n=1 Tax=Tetracentron sinense TaxID=13715 RepID=A0A834YY37_TETSI|nr:hypothetical protein HHK36_018717 [Tetracentron sinense]